MKRTWIKHWLLTLGKALVVLACLLCSLLLVLGLAFGIYVEKNIDKTVDESLFTSVGTASMTRLYHYEFTDRETREGTVSETYEELYGGYRCEYAPLSSIPEDMVNAFVSIEDKRFFEHNGVDWLRTAYAGLNYVCGFRDSFGGSTITQQLIKNVTQEDEYSFDRKITEIFRARDLERKMEKEEILELYLNVINLSQGCYGVGAAAGYYYACDVSELTLGECASIAAITNNPSYYDPLRHPEQNRQRRDLILEAMYEQGYISREECDEALATPVAVRPPKEDALKSTNSWYADMVIEDVIADLMAMGYNRQMASLKVFTGGLVIYTAMDAEVQRTVEQYYADASHFGAGGEEAPQSAMIVIDPKTGDILGVAGAVGDKRANRIQNFATQTLRPAGSVIKPLSVYAPALEEGLITWASVYDDVPVRFGDREDASQSNATPPVAWPKNATGTYRGLTNIHYAVENSVNTVVVRVLQDLGVENSFRFTKNTLHMKSLIEEKRLPDGRVVTDCDLAALALGQFNYGVTVREVTAAYSIFANQGIYNDTRSYLRVTDAQGYDILSKPYHGETVLSEENAALMNKMLEGVIREGTAKSATLDETVSCAGKTGTTQNNCDRWFIGYSPHYICGVWYGYEYPQALPTDSKNICIRVWDEVMKSLHADTDNSQDFAEAAGIVTVSYCRDSGLLPTSACRADARGDRTEEGYFADGTQPTEYCTCHVMAAYDTKHGGVADPDCDPVNVKRIGMITVMRSFPVQVTVTDAQYVWRLLPKDVQPSTDPASPFFANMIEAGTYVGISPSQEQFNRYCRYDFHYVNWLKRQEE